MSSSVEQLHAVVKGHVQGVFFRKTAKTHAVQCQITGSATNLPDGTVEIMAQGTHEQLERFLSLLKKEPGFGRVDSIDAVYSKPTIHFKTFTIL